MPQYFPTQFSRRPLSDYPAAVNNQHAVARHFDFREDVTGNEHGHPPAQARDQVAHDQNLVWIETDGGLVHDDQRRFSENRLGDTHALPGAFGQLADDPLPHTLQITEFEHLFDSSAKFSPRNFF